jgi:hypothetical protein
MYVYVGTENDKGPPLDNEREGRRQEYQRFSANSLENDVNKSYHNCDSIDEKLMISVEKEADVDVGMSDSSDGVYKAAR